MPYLIDGHNLIQSMNDISIEDPNDEAKLVGALRSFMIGQNKKCKVFFDGGLPGGSSRMSCSRVQVHFAHTGQEADANIIACIHHLANPKQWILVSSDRRIREQALKRHIQLVHARDFAQALERPRQYSRERDSSDPPIQVADLEEWYEIFGIDDEPS